MNKMYKAERKKYTAQFYKKNHTTFLITLLSTLLIAALNLWISWVMQQMIDTVSGVPGSLRLSVLARKTQSPDYLQKAMLLLSKRNVIRENR